MIVYRLGPSEHFFWLDSLSLPETMENAETSQKLHSVHSLFFPAWAWLDDDDDDDDDDWTSLRPIIVEHFPHDVCSSQSMDVSTPL